MNRDFYRFFVISLIIVFSISGCTKELEDKIQTLEEEKKALTLESETKEKYVEEILGAVNEIQSNLDTIRARENIISKASSNIETKGISEAEALKKRILGDISDIDTYLQENKKKLSKLQSRIKSYRYKIAGLEKMVENLKNTISQKEMEIAYLKEEISSLNVRVATLETTLRQKERVIKQKEKEINKAHYIIGTWDQLQEKGVVEDQGGFLWFGKTTVTSKNLDLSKFKQVEARKTTQISIDHPLDDVQILTNHSDKTYKLVANGANKTHLKISDTRKFWENSRVLVVLMN